MRPLCALAWRKALRVASPPGDRGGFIMLTRRASEKRLTTATIADGAADRPDEVGIGGCVPGKFAPIRFLGTDEETSNAKDHFLIRRTLAFMIRIWQGKVGQYCCPNWRLARCASAGLSSGPHRTVISGAIGHRGAA
jgi:hypothetical protein